MEENPENKEEVNSYDSKEIRVSGNNEQQVSAEMDTDEFEETSLQTEPVNSNADQPDDIYSKSLLDSTILLKVRDRVVFIREGINEWKCRTIHSRAGKQIGKYKDWFHIVDKKGNIENIDWKSKTLWKRDLTESERVFILQSNTNEKKIKAKVKELNSWKQNDVYEEVDYRNQKLISTRWVLSEKMKDGQIITKAKLVARGFEEQKNDVSTNDSPACSREYYKYH